MRALKALAVVTLIPFFAACGAVKAKDTGGDQKVGSQKVSPIDGEDLDWADGIVSGTGSFKGVDSPYTARATYALSFQLSGRSGVTLVSHGSANLNGGVEMEFSRDPSSNVLSAVFRSGDFAESKTAEFRNFDANDIITLDVEINKVSGDYAGLRITKVNANGTREVVADGMLPSSGTYPHWGVIMRSATVFQATRR